MTRQTYKGVFKPKNPQKYKGDPTNIIYRSSWEKMVMKYLDDNPGVIWWGSEELPIPYRSPIDQKMHRYFPDFIVKVRRKDGLVMTYLWEVKPYSQTKMPVQKRKTHRFLQEAATYAINQEKWRAADIFCREHGWQFQIITEKELGI
jgi:hypothetical protein